MLLTLAQMKAKSFESRRNFILPGVDASHVYVRAWALGCFHSLISTQTFRRALTAWTASVDKECPFSGVTKSGRVWRKVPESDARSVISTQTFRRALTACGGQLRGDKECPFSDVTKSGRVWRKVPESGEGESVFMCERD